MIRAKKDQSVLGCMKEDLAYFVDAFKIKHKCNVNVNYLASNNNAFGNNVNIQAFLFGKRDNTFIVKEMEVFSLQWCYNIKFWNTQDQKFDKIILKE